MNYIRTTVAIFAILPAIWAGEATEATKLPTAVQRKVDRFDRNVERLKQRFLADYKSELDDLTREMERDMNDTTRRGDLDGALAIRAALEELRAKSPETDILGNMVEPTPAKTSRSGSNRVIPGMAGKYRFTNLESGSTFRLVINDNGTYDFNNRNEPYEVRDGEIYFPSINSVFTLGSDRSKSMIGRHYAGPWEGHRLSLVRTGD